MNCVSRTNVLRPLSRTSFRLTNATNANQNQKVEVLGSVIRTPAASRGVCNMSRIIHAKRIHEGSSRMKVLSRSSCREILVPGRGFHSTSVASHGGIERPEPGTGITLHFKDSKGNLLKTVEANEGDDILAIAHEYDIDLEGACEGSVACSTCHVILPSEYYDMLPEPEDDENDMLDMAFGLTDTSRLGCQVKLTKELDGMTVTLPSATRNMFVDGKKPSH